MPVLELSRRATSSAQDCVQCGLCLPSCPTYRVTGLEADSPRGRIHLIKGLSEERIERSAAVLNHLDLCLDCRACETACPSGVVYHELIEQTRAQLAQDGREAIENIALRAVVRHLLPYPFRLKLAILPARVLQRLGFWDQVCQMIKHRVKGRSGATDEWVLKMTRMLPPGPVWESKLSRRYPALAADGQKRATVAWFTGCVGEALFQDVNRQAIALLQHAGCEVIVPRSQRCCGAIHQHNGDQRTACGLARSNLRAYQGALKQGADLIVNAIAGCGAMLKEYPSLLGDDPGYGKLAGGFGDRVCDVTEALVRYPPTYLINKKSLKRVGTYHEACHLAHGQRVTQPPRSVLSWIRGLKMVEMEEADACCGAAGTYNLVQPEMARQLAQRKIRHIQATGASVCVTGNVGCAMHIRSEAIRMGVDLKLVHPVSLLYKACGLGSSHRGCEKWHAL